MKKIVKTVGVITFMGIVSIGSYIVGTTQAKTETKEVETVPNGYIDTTSENFMNNYVDMSKLTDFLADENGLQLYLSDGSGYYWEK